MTKYSSEFIHALAKWQNGWREDPERKLELAERLFESATDIPDAARVKPGETCYRVVLLNKKSIAALFLNWELPEVLSSWTEKRDVAEAFKNYLNEGTIGFIFAHEPENDEVLVNLSALWADTDFTDALEHYKTSDQEFHPALEHFRDNQSEVVLNVRALSFDKIVGLSGRSSFEGICRLAGVQGEPEIEALWKECVDHGHDPDSTIVWLSDKAVDLVLDRVIEHMEQVLSGEKEPLTERRVATEVREGAS